MSHIHTEIEDGKPVQYLRLDIVKKREEKLISSAYHSCQSLSEANDIYDGTALLYKRARIEVLE